MAEIKHYSDMRSTQSDWLGDVPASWPLRRLKYIFSIKKDIAGELGHTVLSVTQKGIRPKDMKDKGQFALDYSKYQLVHSGDFVMNHMDLLTGWVDISEYEGVTSPDYRVFVNSNPEQYVSEYYKYIFQLCYSARIFYGLGQGVAGFGRWRLPADMFLNFVLPVPSVSEQVSIASFLDTCCAEIDFLIDEATQTVSDYRQWKSAIISQAVIKGLNPSISLRESNVEWMGMIPSSWRTIRFNKANWIRARLGWKGLKAEEYVKKGYPFLSAYNIVDNHLQWVPLNYISKERFDESPDIKLSIGDILLVKDGAGIGKVARLDDLPLGESTVNSSLAVITPLPGLDYRYEYYYLQSTLFANIITRLRNGMGVPHLTQEAMKEIRMPLPSLAEQQAIAEYLDQRTTEMDSLITEKEALIADLESYKRSLIYETVTGKRKVV